MIKIKLSEKVEINQPWIMLGDIAEIKGLEGVELEKLKSIKLGKAPAPGYEREISRQLISLYLQDTGYKTSEFKLEMPPQTIVATVWQEISPEELISFAQEYINKQLEFEYENFKIISRFTPAVLRIPDTDYSLKATMNNLEKLPGDISTEIQVYIGDKVIKRVYLSFTVKVIEEVFIAKRNILKGEKIKREDFKKEVRELGDLRGEFIRDFNDPLIKDGLINIPIGSGDVLTDFYLEKPLLISWGDEVQAEVIIGNIRVTTMVKARQSGKKGDYIMVENPESGHRFKAQVVNSHLVRLVRY